MAFKNYTLTTNGLGTQQILCTADASTDIAIVSVQVYGGPSGGTVEFYKRNNEGSSKNFSFVLSVAAEQTVAIDHKIFVPAGVTYACSSAVSGIQICCNAMQLDL